MAPSRNRFYLDAAGRQNPAFLHEFGPLLQVLIHVPTALASNLAGDGKPIPSPAAGFALIDTGASNTCVHEDVLRNLGLNPIDTITSGTAAGHVRHNRYPSRLEFPGEGIDYDFASVTGVDLSGHAVRLTSGATPIVALIGRDVMANWVFTYNGVGGFITISY